jgi:hypothetical protein
LTLSNKDHISALNLDFICITHAIVTKTLEFIGSEQDYVAKMDWSIQQLLVDQIETELHISNPFALGIR